MKKIAIGIVGLVLFGAGVSLRGAEAEKKGSASVQADHPQKKLFETKCASCHGKDAQGNVNLAKAMKWDPVTLNLVSKESVAKKDADLEAITAKGQGKMPAYEKQLKPEDIKGLISYIRSLTPSTPPPEKK